MSRSIGIVVVIALVSALAACGGDGTEPERRPTLAPAVADPLAREADAVATLLEAGDACAAKERADRLQSEVEQAIAAGEVPRPLQGPLRQATARLAGDIVCTPVAPPADESDGEEEDDAPDAEAGSCDELETRKAEIDAEKESLKEEVEDEEERKEREKALEEEKKAIEEQLKACGEGG